MKKVGLLFLLGLCLVVRTDLMLLLVVPVDEEEWGQMEVHPAGNDGSDAETPPLVISTSSSRGKRKAVSYEAIEDLASHARGDEEGGDGDLDNEHSVDSHQSQQTSHSLAASSASGLLSLSNSNTNSASTPTSGSGLYGSRFKAPDVDEVISDTSGRSKGGSGLKRDGTWWDKLTGGVKSSERKQERRQASISLEPIRDPAPPPDLDPIDENRFTNIDYEDVDEGSGESGFFVQRKSLDSDEIGRNLESGGIGSLGAKRKKLAANRSMDSKKSAQTATSSLLEGLVDMVVSRRERTASSTVNYEEEDDETESQLNRSYTTPVMSKTLSNSTIVSSSTQTGRSNTTVSSSELTHYSGMLPMAAPIDKGLSGSPEALAIPLNRESVKVVLPIIFRI
jgi:hypothetical protein